MNTLIKIPKLTLNNLIKSENDQFIDFYYCVDSIKNTGDALVSLLTQMKEYTHFKVLWDFKNGTEIDKKKWYVLADNIMVYKNTDTSDKNRLIVDGSTNYEAAFWLRVVKKHINCSEEYIYSKCSKCGHINDIYVDKNIKGLTCGLGYWSDKI